MRALVKTSSPPGVELGEAPEPQPRSNEALVDVEAFSLNRGEVRRLPAQPDGTVIGWDVAGTVAEPAQDGSGPPKGARVVGLVNPGAWAERAAVPTSELAELPDEVTFAQAATLPIAGMTALRMLALGGLLLEKRVLITGASGGVGRIAIQLAHRAGAHVTGVVGSPERGEGLKDLGADELITQIEGDPYDLILDGVGGASLARALTHAAPEGTVVAFGHSAHGEETTFDVSAFYRNATGASLYAFMIFDELARNHGAGSRDLQTLATLVANGELDPQIGLEDSWRGAGEAIQKLIDRSVPGKAVLHVD